MALAKWEMNIGSGNEGAIKQQAITWDNVHPDLFRHIASLGRSVLMLNEDHLGHIC